MKESSTGKKPGQPLYPNPPSGGLGALAGVRGIFIGASAGGISALRLVLAGAGARCAPIAVVQHLPEDAEIDVKTLFQQTAGARVLQAEENGPFAAGHIYFAPPGYHLLVGRDHKLALCVSEPVNWSRPSIDVLLESAARTYGPSALGVILTGASSDSAAGLRKIREAGGTAVVQDPLSAEVATMPETALRAASPQYVLGLGEIRDLLAECNLKGGDSRQ